MNAPEVTIDLLSLASRSNMLVSLYQACIINRVQFITRDRDIRLKSQNSTVYVPGTGHEIFYGQLQNILEFLYLNGFSVVLFICRWLKCDARQMVIEKKITSINISAETYKDNQAK